jgi:hypothetical protein
VRGPEDNLLKVIARESNPSRAGAFSGLLEMRQLSQAENVAFLNHVSTGQSRPAIALEEDLPANSLGEISVGVRRSR